MNKTVSRPAMKSMKMRLLCHFSIDPLSVMISFPPSIGTTPFLYYSCCFGARGRLILVIIFISAASVPLQRCREMKSCCLHSVAGGLWWKCQDK